MTPPLQIIFVRPLMETMPQDQGFQIQTIDVDDVEKDCINVPTTSWVQKGA